MQMSHFTAYASIFARPYSKGKKVVKVSVTISNHPRICLGKHLRIAERRERKRVRFMQICFSLLLSFNRQSSQSLLNEHTCTIIKTVSEKWPQWLPGWLTLAWAPMGNFPKAEDFDKIQKTTKTFLRNRFRYLWCETIFPQNSPSIQCKSGG